MILSNGFAFICGTLEFLRCLMPSYCCTVIATLLRMELFMVTSWTTGRHPFIVAGNKISNSTYFSNGSFQMCTGIIWLIAIHASLPLRKYVLKRLSVKGKHCLDVHELVLMLRYCLPSTIIPANLLAQVGSSTCSYRDTVNLHWVWSNNPQIIDLSLVVIWLEFGASSGTGMGRDGISRNWKAIYYPRFKELSSSKYKRLYGNSLQQVPVLARTYWKQVLTTIWTSEFWKILLLAYNLVLLAFCQILQRLTSPPPPFRFPLWQHWIEASAFTQWAAVHLS